MLSILYTTIDDTLHIKCKKKNKDCKSKVDLIIVAIVQRSNAKCNKKAKICKSMENIPTRNSQMHNYIWCSW